MLDEIGRVRKSADNILVNELLYDKITGFPTTPTLIKDIHSLLESGCPIDIIYFSISKLRKVEEVLGWQLIDRVLQFIAKKLVAIAQETLCEQDILAIDRAAGDEFIVFISSPECYHRKKEIPLKVFGEKIIATLKQFIVQEFGPQIALQFDFYLGLSSIVYNPMIRLERLVYDAISEAVSYAINQEKRDLLQNIDRLNQMIAEEKIITNFQPIINLRTFEIIGYEAISRGISDDFCQQPEFLFDLANQADIIWQLERVCRKQALENARDLPEGQLLFLNLDPNAANDPALKNSDILFNTPISPQQLVLEITERASINNFPRFKKHCNALQKIGFQIAIDDAGSGYASLQSITELEPDFIKFDMTLVRDISTTYIKQSLMEVLVRFSKKMNIPLIAEGIETIDEYLALLQLNVPCGQGFLFSKPLPTFNEVQKAIKQSQKVIEVYRHD